MHSALNRLPPVSIADTLGNNPGIVDLWYWFYEKVDVYNWTTAFETLLTADERERHDRFRFKRDRRQFLATRALVRTVLSNYLPVQPAAWRFAVNNFGKPRIAHPAISPLIHFNLSNTPGLVACAISVAHDALGVDVEALNQNGYSAEIAEHNFAPSEAHALKELSLCDQQRRFFEYWTLKESYIKASSVGLTLPLSHFSIVICPDNISIVLPNYLEDKGAHWRFALLDVEPHYLVAISVNTGDAQLSLRVAQVTSMRGTISTTKDLYLT